jgi:putrescine aminotransferase
VGETRGTGLWTAIDFTVDKKTRAPLPAEHLANMIERAKKKGLIIKPAPVRQALEFAPALTIQKEEIDEAIKIIGECISEEEKEMGI